MSEVQPGVWVSEITLPYPPSVNHYYAVVRGRKILSAEGRRYKQSAASIAMALGIRPLSGNVSIRMDLYRPRKSGDLDNAMKSLFDSLSGIAWHDDKQITYIEARRHDDKFNPRVEVRIRSVA